MSVARKSWATAAQLAGLPDLPESERGVKARAVREGWSARKRQGRGGGLEYAIADLPAAARAAFVNAIGPRALLKADLDRGAAQDAREAGLAKLATLNERQRGRAEARAFVLSAFREFSTGRGLPKADVREMFSSMYNAGEVSIDPWVRDALPRLSPRSLKRWGERTSKEGIAALAWNKGKRRRGTGIIESDREAHDLILGLFAERPHVSAKHVMRSLRARFKDDPARVPAERTVQRFMAAWKRDNAQLFAAVSNPDAWRSRYQAAGGSADEAVIALNAVWELDSTPGDVLLADGKRHAIVGVIDVWSRRLKLHVARTSNSVAICALMRRALLDWGVPACAKTDQGADYTSRHFAGALAALGIAHRRCPPFTPESKPFIERAFGTLTRDMIELLPEYIGHDVAGRKAIEARRSFAQRMMKRGEALELRRTPEEFQAFLDRWCEDFYAHDAHAGLGGRTPFERAAEWNGPVTEIADERALDILLAETPDGGLRRVTKKGLRVDRLNFDHPALAGHEGRRVKIRYDEADVGRVYVFAEDGAFICRAEAPEVTGVSRKEVSSHRKARQKQIISNGKKALKAVAKRAGTKDIVNEILTERAEAAGRLVQFPRKRKAHESEDLMEAVRAAASLEPAEPAPLTPEQQAAADAAFAQIQAREAPDNVTRFNPPPRDTGDRPFFATDEAWARWIIDNRDKASPDEEARLIERMRSNSFRLLVGRDWEEAGHDPRVAQS